DPAAGGARVQARDDGHRDLALDPLERGEVAVGGAHECIDGREVVEGLGELLGALLERAAELDLLAHDLLFEQRWEDDGSHPRTLKEPGGQRLPVVRSRGGDDRRAEVETEVAAMQVDSHAPSPSPRSEERRV